MASVKLSSRLKKSLDLFHGTGTILMKDLHISLDEALPRVKGFQEAPESRDEVIFWTKTFIRCLMGLLDGLSYAMRQVVLARAADGGLILTNKDRAQLTERKYDATADTILADPRFISTLDSLKSSVRWFSRAFGGTFELDTSGGGWRALKRIASVRNGLTHPRSLEDLAVHPAFGAISPASVWVGSEIRRLWGEVSQSLGVELSSFTEDLAVGPVVFNETANWDKMFSESDYELIAAVGSRSLEYVNRMLFMLSDETKLALDLCADSFASRNALQLPRFQFAYRTLTRTMFSNIEGQISAVEFFLEAGAKRGKVTLSDTDRESMEAGDVEDRLVATTNLWSREFGSGEELQKAGDDWKCLRGARAFRNRITHPKEVQFLQVDSPMTGTLLNGYGFYLNTFGNLQIDEEKWIAKAGALGEMIQSEDLSEEGGLSKEDDAIGRIS